MRKKQNKKSPNRGLGKNSIWLALGGMVLCVTMLALAACDTMGNLTNSSSPVISGTPLPSAAASSAVASIAPSSVPASSEPASSASVASTSSVASQASKPASSSEPATSPASKVDPVPDGDEMFEHSAFVGNSLIDDLYTYGIVKNADYYFRVGLSVQTVFTKTMTTGKVPVIDELKGKNYDKVFLMFGENELGWSYSQKFIEEYGRVIDAVRERQPSATIYIHSIFPVTKKASDKNQYNVNNTRINQYNALLKQMAADKNVVYLDVASVLKDSNGNLPAEGSSDGVHPNKKYCQIWIDYVKQELRKESDHHEKKAVA